MPICGRKPKECFETFADHIRPLIQGVLGVSVHVRFIRQSDEAKRSMSVRGPESEDWLRLESTKFGQVYLQLAQTLVARRDADGKGYALKTQQYWYRVYEHEPGLEDEPLFRWENGPLEGKTHCKYHFHVGKVFTGGKQVPIELERNGVPMSLTQLHLPTGYVLIEYVLRFLISDLGVQPACGDGWEGILSKSERTFFEEFSPKPK